MSRALCQQERGTDSLVLVFICEDGEVWLIPYDDISALSGRSDGPPSRFSNFGLLAKFRGFYSDYETANIMAGDLPCDPLDSEFAASIYRDLERLAGEARS